MVANAMSMSLSLPAWTTRICCPTFRAASCTSRNRVCKFGLFGLTSTAMTAAVGTSSRISSSRFDSTSPKKGYPREVASRSAEAGDETVPDRVATDGKDDGNCRGRSPGRNRCGKVVGKDGGHLIANQLGSEVGKAIILVRIPQFDDYIASFDITQVVQALAERCQAIRHRWLSRVQPSDNRDRCLLRTRRERPRGRRPAEQRDELAALHVWMAPAWQEIIWRAAQRSLAVMCPACWCSPGGLLALMGSANRVLIIRTGSMSR